VRALLALPLAALLLVPMVHAPAPADTAVRFVLLGDTGHGNPTQFQVASAASSVCAARGCDLALIAGDNLYPAGPSSAYDPIFDAKFELPYRGFPAPIWLTLGNHDNGDLSGMGRGDGGQSFRGDFEVDYAHRTDRPSDLWHMPARNYTFRVGPAQFWSLDTNTLVWMGDPLGVRDPAGLEQLLWFQQSMAASDAPWKLVFGHYPYLSNGDAGDAGIYNGVPGLGVLVKTFVEAAVCGKADFYFAGHDHDLQWLLPGSCGATQLLISGAGSSGDTISAPDRHPVYWQQGETPGFAWVELDEDSFTAAFYDANANALFEQTLGKPIR